MNAEQMYTSVTKRRYYPGGSSMMREWVILTTDPFQSFVVIIEFLKKTVTHQLLKLLRIFTCADKG